MEQIKQAVFEYENSNDPDGLLARILGHLSISLKYANNIRILAGKIPWTYPFSSDVLYYVPFEALTKLTVEDRESLYNLKLDRIADDMRGIPNIVKGKDSEELRAYGERINLYLKSLTMAELIQLRRTALHFRFSTMVRRRATVEMFNRFGVDINLLPESDIYSEIIPEARALLAKKHRGKGGALAVVEPNELDDLVNAVARFDPLENIEGIKPETAYATFRRSRRAKLTFEQFMKLASDEGYELDKYGRFITKSLKIKLIPEFFTEVPAEWKEVEAISKAFVSFPASFLKKEQVQEFIDNLPNTEQLVLQLKNHGNFDFGPLLTSLLPQLIANGKLKEARDIYLLCKTSVTSLKHPETWKQWESYVAKKLPSYEESCAVTAVEAASIHLIKR